MADNQNINNQNGFPNRKIIGEKINELFSNKEGKMIRTILIANFIVIVICSILYYNYILLGEFFTTIFLAFICSLALKPSKDKLIYKLKMHYREKNKYFVRRSWIFLVLRILQIVRLFNFISSYFDKSDIPRYGVQSEHLNTKQTVESEHLEEDKSKYTIYNDIIYLIFISCVYIMIFKFKIFISVTIISIYFFVDFSTRLTIDFCIILSKRFENNRFILNDNNTPREYVNSIISSFMIMFYILFVLLVIILGIVSIYLDLKKIYLYLNENNDFLNVIKDNFLTSDKIKNYQQTIFEQFNSFEEYLNNTYIKIDSQYGTQSTILRGGNYTLYGKFSNKIDLSNKLIYILNNPMLVVESEGQSEAEKNITYKLTCEEYQNTLISILNRVFSSDYIVKFHCSTRVLLKELNIDIDNFIKENFMLYIKRFYGIFKLVFNLFASTIFYSIIRFSLEIINTVFLIVLFFTCLFYFLKSDGNFVKETLYILPVNQKNLEMITNEFNRSLEGIFISTLQIFISNILITWLIFDLCGIDFVYIFAFFSGLLSLLPVLSPFLILFPATIILGIKKAWCYYSIIEIITLNISYIIIIIKVDNSIYKKHFDTPPYITGLSFVMGMYAFGFKGIVYGPLLLCLSMLISQVFANIMEKKNI